ncbi:30S ribosomal protein S16 [Posidoniimonas polymericola]|uniref:Small ribosomal subunit protein bS16 n=1 Tax=Posidoniimonas polymericola TaxID=2528002 RepID=A0A5C5YEU1_9BACT|nr:30S ribosomal protein S16 [Posidoniimonas polymericola]TWT73508.1 30S ribosomal protein S16 [Posidoniimonas polymericola]
MSVRIRMKKMGRTHRPFFRICAMDKRSPRDGRVLEELGTYDPMVPETDARALLKKERVEYWLGVGAQPSEKVAVLIKKYGPEGTHLDAQKQALDRLAMGREVPDPGEPASLPKAPEPEKPAEEAAAPAAEGAAEGAAEEKPAEEAAAEAPAEEAKADDAAPAEEAPAAEESSEEKPAE